MRGHVRWCMGDVGVYVRVSVVGVVGVVVGVVHERVRAHAHLRRMWW